jgi:AAA family ATP:ADP antiporter
MPTPEKHKKSMLESLLSVVTAIKPGEGATAALMAVNIFTLLAAYYILKPVREVYVSPDWANAGTAIMAVLLIPIVKAYGAVARKLARKKLISYVTGFFISNLVIFYILAEIQFRYMGVLFFVWVGIFNNMVIASSGPMATIFTTRSRKTPVPANRVGPSIGAIVDR